MLGDISLATNIYIVTGYTDMRKSIDGLCAIVLDLDLCQYFGHKKLKVHADFFNSSSSFCWGVI